MLENCVNQAAGLQTLVPQLAPRLVAVASHGQQQGELPLLWALCNAWVDMGLSVLVLDGHAQESPKNAGLTHLLDNPLERCQNADESVSWSVLPAALGFERLGKQGKPGAALAELFHNYAVVMVYANTQTLTGLFKQSGLAPLLVLPPLKAASLTAYEALKQLLQKAQLHPTVANIALPAIGSPTMPYSTPSQHLQQCALAFLGYQVRPITVSAGGQANNNAPDGVNRLALQLLENAVLFRAASIGEDALMYTAKGQLERNALIRQYQPLVRKLAHHMMAKLPANVQVDDLIQVGLIGLSEALSRFEATQGVQFETFATQRIRGAMLDELRENDWASRGTRKSQKEIEEAMRRLEHMLGRTPMESEIAASLEMSLSDYQSLLTKVQGTQLIYLEDMSHGQDDEDSFLDRHMGDVDADPVNVLRDQRLRTALVAAIKNLPEREQHIMSMYYEQDMNLKEIAAVLDVTESRICQLHSQSIARLRAKMRTH